MALLLMMAELFPSIASEIYELSVTWMSPSLFPSSSTASPSCMPLFRRSGVSMYDLWYIRKWNTKSRIVKKSEDLLVFDIGDAPSFMDEVSFSRQVFCGGPSLNCLEK